MVNAVAAKKQVMLASRNRLSDRVMPATLHQLEDKLALTLAAKKDTGTLAKKHDQWVREDSARLRADDLVERKEKAKIDAEDKRRRDRDEAEHRQAQAARAREDKQERDEKASWTTSATLDTQRVRAQALEEQAKKYEAERKAVEAEEGAKVRG